MANNYLKGNSSPVKTSLSYIKQPANIGHPRIENVQQLESLLTQILDQSGSSKVLSSKSRRGKKSSTPFCVLKKVLTEALSNDFFSSTLPFIIELVNSEKFTDTVRGLKLATQQSNLEISLTQHECAYILANAFLCTWPEQPQNYPEINFAELFSTDSPQNYGKIKCLISYFNQIKDSVANNCNLETLVVFKRKRSGSIIIDSSQDLNTVNVEIFADKKSINDFPTALQADFANKFLGGGVLRAGCTQEEIKFITCPELICSLLFEERLDHNEAIIISNVTKYCYSDGYMRSFKFSGATQQPRTTFSTVAIDSLKIGRDVKEIEQYSRATVERDLHKVYAGLIAAEESDFATGFWGCGVYGCDVYLKFLIQLIACNITGKNMMFTCYDNQSWKPKLENFYNNIKKMSIKHVMDRVQGYYELRKNRGKKFKMNLGEFFAQPVSESTKQIDNQKEIERLKRLILQNDRAVRKVVRLKEDLNDGEELTVEEQDSINAEDNLRSVGDELKKQLLDLGEQPFPVNDKQNHKEIRRLNGLIKKNERALKKIFRLKEAASDGGKELTVEEYDSIKAEANLRSVGENLKKQLKKFEC